MDDIKRRFLTAIAAKGLTQTSWANKHQKDSFTVQRLNAILQGREKGKLEGSLAWKIRKAVEREINNYEKEKK